MPAAAPVSTALLGYGFAGKTFHAPLIGAEPGLALTLVVSRDAAKVHADLPQTEVLARAEDAFAREDIELIVIAGPNETHYPLAKAALRAGKHVVVDKPFTLTLAEARELLPLAEARQRLLSVFQNRRWDSDFLSLRALMSEGRLGEILHFESHFDRYRPKVRQRWRESREPGGGIWYDLGPHLVDQALSLFGLPQQVRASFATQRAGAVIDDWAHVILEYDRLRVLLHASMLVAGGARRFVVHGEHGSWIKHGADRQEAQLLSGLEPGGAGWGIDDDPGQFHDGSGAVQSIPAAAGDYRHYYRGIHDTLRHGAPNPVPAAQALATMAVIETAIASSVQRQAIPLPLTALEFAACADAMP